MQILLSCAKDMIAQAECAKIQQTEPLFLQQAINNAREMAAYSAEELSSMLKINAQLGAINKMRYNDFMLPQTTLPAVLAYSGIAYKYLNAQSFSKKQMNFAQKHLWITSFLYGLLRPCDGIKNYRLEGNVVLPNNNQSMFDYWKPLLTDCLIDSVKQDDGILVYLASAEMKRLFDWKRVTKAIKVIQPEFMVHKDGKLKSIVVYAKMCRGTMTRYIIENECKHIDQLKDFDFEGFEFHSEDKKAGKLLFTLG